SETASQGGDPLPEQADVVLPGLAEKRACQGFGFVLLPRANRIAKSNVIPGGDSQAIRFVPFEQVHAAYPFNRWVDHMRNKFEFGIAGSGTNGVVEISVCGSP